MNIALKVAIAAQGMTSREVSLRTHISEARMTSLIHRRGTGPTTREKRLLSRCLKVPQKTLFPMPPPEPTTTTAATEALAS